MEAISWRHLCRQTGFRLIGVFLHPGTRFDFIAVRVTLLVQDYVRGHRQAKTGVIQNVAARVQDAKHSVTFANFAVAEGFRIAFAINSECAIGDGKPDEVHTVAC